MLENEITKITEINIKEMANITENCKMLDNYYK